MTLFDWILLILLLFAAVSGYRHGIAAQLGGILGLVIGVFLAFKFGELVGRWFGGDGVIASVVGFLAVFFGVVIGLGILGRMMRGLFRFAGLGAVDSVGGLLLGVLKMALFLSVLLIVFEPINKRTNWISETQLERSVLYNPVRKVATVAFPYLQFAAKQLPSLLNLDLGNDNDENENDRRI